MIKRKILLAEDDEDDQKFFADFLQSREDISLMPIAENGEVLINILENITENEKLPEFIILDQNMPKRNGLQTLSALKQNHRYRNIPVMIYSTYIDNSLVENGQKMGACIVLPKPITQEGYDKLINTFFLTCA